MRQWKQLAPPYERPELRAEAGYIPPLSDNDAVDLQMLAGLDTNAIDLLITEDKDLRRHAVKAGLAERVLSIRGGIEYLERLFGEPVVLPTVERRYAYELSVTDAIFDSLREDYDGFNDWFARASRDHRDCLVIFGQDGALEAVAILKVETDNPWGLTGQVLKVCTFKVAPQAGGAKRGELVLKAIFHYATEKNVDSLYVEVFSAHEGVIRLFAHYGFHPLETATGRGEQVMVKNRRPPPTADGWDALSFHRDFGPQAVLVRDVFIIPIQPRWHDVLFPECRIQEQLFGPEPSGNAIMKAYLSRSQITTLEPGALILFYRSGDLHAVTAVGVVDDTLRSSDPVAVRQFVSLRTVYPDAEIQRLCAAATGNGLLAILFRHDRSLPDPWSRQTLQDAGVLNGPPQSIQKVTSEGALNWIRSQLNAPL
jgi:L-amino acid N-acyltransferase YncA